MISITQGLLLCIKLKLLLHYNDPIIILASDILHVNHIQIPISFNLISKIIQLLYPKF